MVSYFERFLRFWRLFRRYLTNFRSWFGNRVSNQSSHLPVGWHSGQCFVYCASAKVGRTTGDGFAKCPTGWLAAHPTSPDASWQGRLCSSRAIALCVVLSSAGRDSSDVAKTGHTFYRKEEGPPGRCTTRHRRATVYGKLLRR